LKFCTPTLLLREGVPFPLPDPIVIFRQYLDLWNRFSGIPLDGALPSVLRESLLLKDFRLRARPVEDRNQPATYFSGSATFRLRGRHPETVLKGFNTLADFAFFCGTGAETDRGRGMTRRILAGTRETESRLQMRNPFTGWTAPCRVDP
jgi:CRISPR-associated endoribonuclease Cas6